jgi:hypothetical protein
VGGGCCNVRKGKEFGGGGMVKKKEVIFLELKICSKITARKVG